MKSKIFTPLFLGIIFMGFNLSQAQNLLTDGHFGTTTEILPCINGNCAANVWSFWQSDETAATATVTDGTCHLQISEGGLEMWEIQLIQRGFPLTLGHWYRLTFAVRADAERWFGLFLGEEGNGWTSLVGYENYYQHATTEWQTKSFDFQAYSIFDSHKLSFEAGGSTVGMYFDNVFLEDLGPYPSIGIIGTAVAGWVDDVDLSTTDGKTYVLSDYYLNSGHAKFRLGNSWAVNWGADAFPSGTAYPYGPDIPILTGGNYDITFDLETGDYSFICIRNCQASVGIIGTAVSPFFDWNTDVDMTTTDGVMYSLSNQLFINGSAKFRQDNSWDVNWGSDQFPSGTAWPGGPDIPVIEGIYKVTFNLETGEFSFEWPRVGILGSALNGWTDDIDLETVDGVKYTLNATFTDGEVKFRLDDQWNVNWGNYTFPSGYGYEGGPNIPVPAGNYQVTFNLYSGEYFFESTQCRMECPEPVWVGNTPGLCGAYVHYPEVVQKGICETDGLMIEQIAGLPSGSFFPLGVTTNTFTLSDSTGELYVCSFDVFVYDIEPPVIENFTAVFDSPWPPNHQMALLNLNYTISDNCDTMIIPEIYVFSSQDYDKTGAGHTGIDWEILNEHQVLLRAERTGRGDDRMYYIYVVCYDAFYNYAFESALVTIPHDQRNRAEKPGTIETKTDALAGKSAKIEDNPLALPFQFKVWPNPGSANFYVQVESNSNEVIGLSVMDMSGKVMIELTGTKGQLFTFGENLLPGTYLLAIRQGRFANRIKLVKQ